MRSLWEITLISDYLPEYKRYVAFYTYKEGENPAPIAEMLAKALRLFLAAPHAYGEKW